MLTERQPRQKRERFFYKFLSNYLVPPLPNGGGRQGYDHGVVFFKCFSKNRENILVLKKMLKSLSFLFYFMFQGISNKKFKYCYQTYSFFHASTFYYRQFLKVQIPLILTEKNFTLRMHWIMMYGATRTHCNPPKNPRLGSLAW